MSFYYFIMFRCTLTSIHCYWRHLVSVQPALARAWTCLSLPQVGRLAVLLYCDPDFSFYCDAHSDPHPAPQQSDASLRPLVCTAPFWASAPLFGACAALHWFHFEHLDFLNFDFIADPDPGFHYDAYPNIQIQLLK